MKSKKLSDHEQVIAFLQQLNHPLKKEIEEARNMILQSNDQITEHIKWNAPSFCVNNQDRITFNLHGKKGFRLIFHCGSKKTQYENNGPLFIDETGLLEWITGDRATVTITSQEDLMGQNRTRLINAINKWIEITSDIL